MDRFRRYEGELALESTQEQSNYVGLPAARPSARDQ
jgi:hypothetical protein